MWHSPVVHKPVSHASSAASEDRVSRPQLLVAAAILLAVHVAYRAWALYGSWFYTDDYRLLFDATTSPLTLSYLTTPFDSQFMPVGRLVAWIVASSGSLNWPLAATITLAFQTLAGIACLWMLVTLFGSRWAVLPLFALYLSTAITVPAMMWWAASLNQVPLQAVMFVSVAGWVQFLRGRGRRYLVVAALAVTVGLLTYVKTALVIALLGYLLLAYFTQGSFRKRVVWAVRRHWLGLVTMLTIAMGYALYYATSVPQPFDRGAPGEALRLADTMLGTAFITGAFGGPWRWTAENPPTSLADPPMWTVHAAWAVALMVVLVAALTRRRVWRSWLLLAGYLVALLALVAASRATVVGSAIGLEYRYLTDAAGVLVLTLGLAFLPVAGSRESSEPRRHPLLLVPTGPAWVAAVGAVCLGGVVSAYGHVTTWHRDNPGEVFVKRATSQLTAQSGVVDLVDGPVPQAVVPGYSAPYNFASRLTRLVAAETTFPSVSSELAMLGDDGGLRRVLIEPGVTNQPGPVDECGWRVDPGGAVVPLSGRVYEWDWWMRIGYLASQTSDVTVTAGETRRTTQLQPGLNSLYVKNTGGFDEVSITGLAPGTTLCVDRVEVGKPVPGALL